MPDVDDRFEWLRPVDLEGDREAEQLAAGLRRPLTVLTDRKGDQHYVAYDTAAEADMAAESSDESGLDLLFGSEADDEADRVAVDDLNPGQRAVAEALVDAFPRTRTLTNGQIEEDVDYGDSTVRQATRLLADNGWVVDVSDEGDRKKEYRATEDLREAIHEGPTP